MTDVPGSPTSLTAAATGDDAAATRDATAGVFAADLDTPVGRLAVVLDGDGTVLASGFGGHETLLDRLGLDHTPPPAAPTTLAPVVAAVEAYVAGDGEALAQVPVRQHGGPFAQRAWEELRDVPPGESITYAELAARAGSPGAARAAGQACARNLVAPFVPCHRVVPAGGGVGGYAYGADVKRRLLRHERGAP